MQKHMSVLILICAMYAQAYQDQADFQIIQSFILSLKPTRIAPDDAHEIARWCVHYGNQFMVDPLLLASLIYRESTFNPRAVSVTGAQGLGQIKSMNFPDLEITDPFNIEQNVKGTAKYLNRMLGLWTDHPDRLELGLASYFKGFTGIKRVNNTIEGKTAGYVDNILEKYQQLCDKKQGIRAL